MFASKDTLLTRPSGYNIARSVRLRSSASAYLNRTPSVAGNQKTWTWSAWVKRGKLGATQGLFARNDASVATYLIFTSSDTLEMTSASGAVDLDLVTTQVFRDPSAWYHLVLAVDTTQATASNRIKMYVNGIQITSFSTATYPAQNYNTYVNTAATHYIGNGNPAGSLGWYSDQYLTEINFVNAQQLTPSSFGETDSITGVWKPKKYAGTYGTNGFYLNFSDNSSNTATTIGKDYSGNGNNWTPNNISVTAGATYDSMTDVPTLTSATAANYCVLNPLNKSSSSTVSNGNLRQTSSGGWYRAYSTIFFDSTAVFYAEATMTALNSGANGVRVGIANANSVFTYLGSDANSWSYDNQGNKYNNGTLGAYGASYVQGDVIGILFNNGSLTFYKNGASQGVAYSGLTGTFCFAGSPFDTDIVDWNFGQRPFSNLPSGALALNTYNLPASTITNGAAYMAATTYTGNGSSLAVSNAVNGVSFQPDLVWIKARGNTYSHNIEDSVRGVTLRLQSDSTAAEAVGANGQVTAFSSGGFTQNGGVETGGSSATYVAWQWKAGGTSSSNTNGSITSTVSAGATQGFSVVTYTGTGVTATVGHGLGVAPKMIIVKNRAAAESWRVGHSFMNNGSSPWSYYMNLNGTGAQVLEPAVWNSTAPTSTVFSISNDSAVSGNGQSHVAYCFAAVAGYSAFGSYTANVSADGPFIYTGFRPRWIMLKRSSAASAPWSMIDTSRSSFNAAKAELDANVSDAETTAGNGMDILSNGFKLRDSGYFNSASGATFIYAAFAENPFKNALAR